MSIPENRLEINGPQNEKKKKKLFVGQKLTQWKTLFFTFAFDCFFLGFYNFITLYISSVLTQLVIKVAFNRAIYA